VGALATNGQRTAVAETTVGLNFDKALDVEGDVLAEIAFDLALGLDDVTDAIERVLVEGAGLGEGINVGGGEDLCRARVADAEDVGESDAYLFVIGYVDSSNTCHGVPFRLGSRALMATGAGWMVSGWILQVRRKP
jgi:hypothetical protein